MTRNWIAAHIYHTGDLNLLLTRQIAPFIEQHKHLLDQGTPYFFIRYPAGGDHIRLRMNTLNEHELKQKLCFPDMQYFPYEPEDERYANIALAEQHFAVSSQVIMEWLCRGKGSHHIQAIQLHLLLLLSTGWSPADLLLLCEYFTNDWLTIFRTDGMKDKFNQAFHPQQEILFNATLEFWNNATKENISPSLLYYLKENSRIMSAYNADQYTTQQLTIAITSMMHMTHNRLGIENAEEAYIMYCTQACLSNIISHEHN